MSKGTRQPREAVMPAITALVSALSNLGVICQIAGSIRRECETVGDVDIICRAQEGFLSMRHDVEGKIDGLTISRGGCKAVFGEYKGVDVNLVSIPEESWGAGLLHATGSPHFNIVCRGRALRKGWKLNQYGLFDGSRVIEGRDEARLLRLIGIPWTHPRDRGGKKAAQETVSVWVTSSTNPNVKYQVVTDSVTGRMTCGCKGFKHHGHCKHCDSVRGEALSNS